MDSTDRLDGLELITRAPHPRLRGLVRGYEGYVETATALRRQQVPGDIVPLIISYGEPVGLIDPRRPGEMDRRNVFVAGLSDTYVVTESSPSYGVQINFTPIGARMFLGIPMSELTNRTIGLDDAFGAEGARLVERLHGARDWEKRFAMLDAAILTRIDAAPPPSEAVVLAWYRLNRSGGKASIASLAEELGWSGKHLIAQFRDQVGLAPKTAARVIRFNAAIRRLRSGVSLDWADVVAECGYYDQAHLLREFREFAGMTPREFLRGQLPRMAAFSD
ncbi:MAG: helix-turn-helix domain-containing protein [Dehalococcoidia bacterium]